MGLARTIATRHGLAFLERGSLRLFALPAARRLVEACIQEGVAVAGLEGFHVLAARTEPEVNAIADFSDLMGLPRPERALRTGWEAMTFLERVNDQDLFFDFALVQEEVAAPT